MAPRKSNGSQGHGSRFSKQTPASSPVPSQLPNRGGFSSFSINSLLNPSPGASSNTGPSSFAPVTAGSYHSFSNMASSQNVNPTQSTGSGQRMIFAPPPSFNSTPGQFTIFNPPSSSSSIFSPPSNASATTNSTPRPHSFTQTPTIIYPNPHPGPITTLAPASRVHALAAIIYALNPSETYTSIVRSLVERVVRLDSEMGGLGDLGGQCREPPYVVTPELAVLLEPAVEFLPAAEREGGVAGAEIAEIAEMWARRRGGGGGGAAAHGGQGGMGGMGQGSRAMGSMSSIPISTTPPDSDPAAILMNMMTADRTSEEAHRSNFDTEMDDSPSEQEETSVSVSSTPKKRRRTASVSKATPVAKAGAKTASKTKAETGVKAKGKARVKPQEFISALQVSPVMGDGSSEDLYPLAGTEASTSPVSTATSAAPDSSSAASRTTVSSIAPASSTATSTAATAPASTVIVPVATDQMLPPRANAFQSPAGPNASKMPNSDPVPNYTLLDTHERFSLHTAAFIDGIAFKLALKTLVMADSMSDTHNEVAPSNDQTPSNQNPSNNQPSITIAQTQAYMSPTDRMSLNTRKAFDMVFHSGWADQSKKEKSRQVMTRDGRGFLEFGDVLSRL